MLGVRAVLQNIEQTTTFLPVVIIMTRLRYKITYAVFLWASGQLVTYHYFISVDNNHNYTVGSILIRRQFFMGIQIKLSNRTTFSTKTKSCKKINCPIPYKIANLFGPNVQDSRFLSLFRFQSHPFVQFDHVILCFFSSYFTSTRTRQQIRKSQQIALFQ